MRRFLRVDFVVAVTMVAACSRGGEPRGAAVDVAPTVSAPDPRTSANAAGAADAAPPPASIGIARMRPDGTLELDLRGPGGAEARTVYPPSHAEYKRILAHVGALKPGEDGPVPPWPDPWDAAKVEAAAHAHAAKKGWKSDEYGVVIMGTDASGNAVVTLSHADDRRSPRTGARRSVSLRIDPKGYAVVKETALP